MDELRDPSPCPYDALACCTRAKPSPAAELQTPLLECPRAGAGAPHTVSPALAAAAHEFAAREAARQGATRFWQAAMEARQAANREAGRRLRALEAEARRRAAQVCTDQGRPRTMRCRSRRQRDLTCTWNAALRHPCSSRPWRAPLIACDPCLPSACRRRPSYSRGNPGEGSPAAPASCRRR